MNTSLRTLFFRFGLTVTFTFVSGTSFLFGQISPGTLSSGKTIRQESSRPNPLRLPAKEPNAPATIRQTALNTDGDPTAVDLFPSAAVPPKSAAGTADAFAPIHAESITPAHPAPASPAPPVVPPVMTPAPAASSLSNADPFSGLPPQTTVPAGTLPAAVPAAAPSAALPKTAALVPSAGEPTARSHSEGTGTPGHSALEGLQTPHLTIHKVLPEEVVVDQPVTLKCVIKNAGQSTAKNVTITDRVPQGTRLISTIPEAAATATGELAWSVGNLDPNAELVIEMKVLPLREGDIGSVAAVNYSGEASARMTVTRPMLKVDVKAPAEVLLGGTAQIEITISNPGTAAAHNVVLEEHVPDGLYHKDGRILRNTMITKLLPKESKKLVLPLTCTGAGNLINHVTVTADGNLSAEEKTTIRANAPVLSLEIAGAKQRFLERKSEYKLIVGNKGTASAHNVDLELTLPAAVQFVSTNQSGVYEPSSHSVHWALEELPAQESGEIDLAIMPVQTGEHSLRFRGNGANNLKAETVLPMMIDGIPAISFEIAGDASLVEAGKDAVYEIRIMNRGTKAAGNVKVIATLADGMSFVKADGGRSQANGGTVQFETIPQLTPKSEKVFKLTARSMAEGDYRLKIQVFSDDFREPITKEENTRVFK
ncbi:MAG: DUF11 domain-containing protein [Planctomycetaceae bacterium]|jgi:uncharacterized repeat protein (TIGR01451 family)|nr:DUF11 domain-containing protein [Planctomycetaceae bacterium]